jgi:hypothetical protein
MSRKEKFYYQIISGYSDNNIRFNKLIDFLLSIEFEIRIKGSHHILYHHQIDEIINLQPLSNGLAKAYQVKQVRNILLKYKLKLNE